MSSPPEERLDLGTFSSEPEARAWLQARVKKPLEVLASLGTQLYGSITADLIWLGASHPRQRTIAQRLFHGRLQRDGDRWHLLGQMRSPLNPSACRG